MRPYEANLSKRNQIAIVLEKQNLLYGLLKTIVRWSAAVAIVWLSPNLIAPLAGKDTAVALKVALFGDLKFALSIGISVGMTFWAVAERTLRHRKVEYLQGRIKELEMMIDKKRSSSNLTPKGRTNPRDKT